MAGNYYVFNILLPTDTGEIESIRNFTIYPLYTAALGYSGITSLICSGSTWLRPSIMYSSGSVLFNTTWYSDSRSSKYHSLSGSYTFGMRFNPAGISNPPIA